VSEDPHPLVPEGEYEVVFKSSKKARYFGGQKLYVHFQIVSPGPGHGEILWRAYNCEERLRRGMQLSKDLMKFYGSPVRKNMKLSLNLFKKKIFRVRVRTVKQDYKQNEMPEHQWYSVIDSFLEAVTGEVPT